MGSFRIGWEGCLHDKQTQNELIPQLRQIAEIYNSVYFGRFKDRTTLQTFNNTFYEGRILIPSGFFNIPRGPVSSDTLNHLNLELFKGNPASLETIDRITYLVLNKIRLNGLQFKLNTDLGEDIRSKHYFSKISFVFFDFGDDPVNNTLISNNIVEAQFQNKLKHPDKLSNNQHLILTTNGFTYRYRNMDHVYALCEFVKHYYIPDLMIDAFGCECPEIQQMLLNDNESMDTRNEIFTKLTNFFHSAAYGAAKSELRSGV